MKCILHIGTEKTGTTLLQNWLYDNKEKLSQVGIYLMGWPALQINYILFPGISNFYLSLISIIFVSFYVFFSHKLIENHFCALNLFLKKKRLIKFNHKKLYNSIFIS